MSDEKELTIVPSAINEAQQAILTQETPEYAILKRKGPRGKTLSYVEHGWVTEQLNLAFKWNWSWEIKEAMLLPNDQKPTEVCILGRLTVHSPQGDIVKMQFGAAQMRENVTIGSRFKAASSDGLKKAASLLGLALDLYRTTPSNGGNHEEAVTRPLDPDYLRKALAMKSSKYGSRSVGSEQLGLAMGMLEACFAGDKASTEKRRSVLVYLFDTDSGSNLTNGEIIALLDWLKPTKDSGDAYTPDPMAVKEAQFTVRQHMFESGQGEFPIWETDES